MTSPSHSLPPEAVLYLEHMLEVKRRFLVIDRILGAKKPRTFDADTDNEFMWLQVRKIIELVTYSAIASDLERYAALRAKTKGKVADDQKATKILNRLAGISPQFMPVAIDGMVVNAEGMKQLVPPPDEAKQATLDRFTDLFNEASAHLHEANPYVTDAPALGAALRARSRERVTKAYDYLRAALWEHWKSGLEFHSGDDPAGVDRLKDVYIVIFNGPNDVITMMLAERDDA